MTNLEKKLPHLPSCFVDSVPKRHPPILPHAKAERRRRLARSVSAERASRETRPTERQAQDTFLGGKMAGNVSNDMSLIAWMMREADAVARGMDHSTLEANELLGKFRSAEKDLLQLLEETKKVAAYA